MFLIFICPYVVGLHYKQHSSGQRFSGGKNSWGYFTTRTAKGRNCPSETESVDGKSGILWTVCKMFGEIFDLNFGEIFSVNFAIYMYLNLGNIWMGEIPEWATCVNLVKYLNWWNIWIGEITELVYWWNIWMLALCIGEK